MNGRSEILLAFEGELRLALDDALAVHGLTWVFSEEFGLGDSPRLAVLFESEDPVRVSAELPHLDWPSNWITGFQGCADLWIYFDPGAGRVWAEFEGNHLRTWLRDKGHSALAADLDNVGDPAVAARKVARGLGVMLTGTDRG